MTTQDQELLQPLGTAKKPTESTTDPERTPRLKFGFRPDIEGLRALGVALVVAVHAGLPGLPGGFIGVDVFFVISGFLITALLMTEAHNNGRIDVAAFYARRIRRILPPALVVLGVTAWLHYVWLGQLSFYDALGDYLATLFNGVNWWFIHQGNNYFAAGAETSLLTHYWSLAVEEQFYLVWPWLLIIGCLPWCQQRFPRRVWWWAILLTIGAISFALSIWQTNNTPELAYFATHTRAWQFAAGAILALLAVGGPQFMATQSASTARSCLGWVGLAAVLWAAITITETTPYPGTAAILPTVGTLAMIASGTANPSGWSVTKMFCTPWIRWLGRISFSLYLWHWPLLILTKELFPQSSWWGNLLAVALSVLLAHITYLAVERPMITSTFWRPTRWAFAFGAVAMISVGGVLAILTSHAVSAARTDAEDISVAKNLQEVQSPTAPTPTMTPSKATSAVTEKPFVPSVKAPTSLSLFGATEKTSGRTNPRIFAARKDVGDFKRCILDNTTKVPESCVTGPENGTPVVIFGDSHAHHLAAPIVNIAQDHSWRVHIFTQGGCPAPHISAAAIKAESPKLFRSRCTKFRAETIAKISELQPKIIFSSMRQDYVQDQRQMLEAWQKTFTALKPTGAQWVFIEDVPRPHTDIPKCLSRHRKQWDKCAFEPKVFANQPVRPAASSVGVQAAHISLSDYLCPERTRCPAVINHTLLYRDTDHLTNTAAGLLTEGLRFELHRVGMLPPPTPPAPPTAPESGPVKTATPVLPTATPEPTP